MNKRMNKEAASTTMSYSKRSDCALGRVVVVTWPEVEWCSSHGEALYPRLASPGEGGTLGHRWQYAHYKLI